MSRSITVSLDKRGVASPGCLTMRHPGPARPSGMRCRCRPRCSTARMRVMRYTRCYQFSHRPTRARRTPRSRRSRVTCAGCRSTSATRHTGMRMPLAPGPQARRVDQERQARRGWQDLDLRRRVGLSDVFGERPYPADRKLRLCVPDRDRNSPVGDRSAWPGPRIHAAEVAFSAACLAFHRSRARPPVASASMDTPT
jgi:hypothetical protein